MAKPETIKKINANKNVVNSENQTKKEIEMLLTSEGSDITIRNEKINVKAYNWIQTLKMANPFRTVIHTVFDNSDKIGSLAEFQGASAIKQFYAIVDLFADIDNVEEFADALSEMIAESIGKEKDYVKLLDIDEVVELAIAVFKVNKDFFAQKLEKVMKLIPASKTDLKNEK